MRIASHHFCSFLLLVAASISTASASEFTWQQNDDQGTADLVHDGKPVLRYMYAYDPSNKDRALETYKVYHHVFGPQSGEQITKGAGGKFTHHRGLFVGWNRTQIKGGPTYDFWHCKGGVSLRHVKFEDLTADESGGSMTALIHWADPDGNPVIKEWRTVAVSVQPETKGWVIDWSTRLESQVGTIELSGDRQHAGFQYRASQKVADSNGATYLRPGDFPQQPEAIQVGDKGNPPPHINLGWFAQSYQLGEKRYTVEYYDNPGLPKPSLFSERPYGRFGTYFKTTLSGEEPLNMVYRVVVSEGDSPAVEEITKRYEKFVSSLK